MAKHPNKPQHDDDDADDSFDSTRHHEARSNKIKTEVETKQQTEADDQDIANFRGLPKEGETREQLLDRIRKIREEDAAKPAESTEVFRSPGLQKEFDAEQEAGRAAVAKAQEAADRQNHSVQRAADAEGEKKAG